MIEADINYQQTWEQYGEELKKNSYRFTRENY